MLIQYLCRISCEDIVSLNTCIALQPTNSESTEPCMLDIKITNCQKIARIVIVSEANVLEFFKQSGEYETTIFADFVDEYENNSVYLAEAAIQPPTTEASIKVKSFLHIYTICFYIQCYNISFCVSLPEQEIKVLQCGYMV